MRDDWWNDKEALLWNYNTDAGGWEKDYPGKDIRTYCSRHASEMRHHGYNLRRTEKQWKEECLKCRTHGFEYIQTGNQ